MILSYTALGQEEPFIGTGDIQVNNPPGTSHLSLFVAFLLSTMTDQLAPVIFVS